MKDYYVILGIGSDATLQEIRSAYRQQAKKLHPDYHGPDCGPFRDVQEAYECLSDPGRRQAHDRALAGERRRAASGKPVWSSGAPVEPIDRRRRSKYVREEWGDPFFSSPLDDLFDHMWSDPGLDGLEEQTIHLQVNLSRAQAVHGGRLLVQVPVQVVCSFCQGSGQMLVYRCPRCGGQGSVVERHPVMVTYPGGIEEGAIGRVPLERWGLTLVLHFRISER